MKNKFIDSISYEEVHFIFQTVKGRHSVSSTDSTNSYDYKIRTSSHDEKENLLLLANFEDNDLNEYKDNMSQTARS